MSASCHSLQFRVKNASMVPCLFSLSPSAFSCVVCLFFMLLFFHLSCFFLPSQLSAPCSQPRPGLPRCFATLMQLGTVRNLVASLRSQTFLLITLFLTFFLTSSSHFSPTNVLASRFQTCRLRVRVYSALLSIISHYLSVFSFLFTPISPQDLVELERVPSLYAFRAFVSFSLIPPGPVRPGYLRREVRSHHRGLLP